jgi:hypothetical protein
LLHNSVAYDASSSVPPLPHPFEGVRKSQSVMLIPLCGRSICIALKTNECRSFAPLRACDFFQFGPKVALITKDLSALKWPKIEKSHRLSG